MSSSVLSIFRRNAPPPPPREGHAHPPKGRKDHYKRLIKRSFTWDDHEENHTRDSFRMGKVSHGHFGALN